MLAKAPDASADLVASFARHIVLTRGSVLRIWVGILVGLLGLVLGAFLWMAAVQNASMATGLYAESYAWSAKVAYWAGVASALGGLVAAVLVVRSGRRREDGQ